MKIVIVAIAALLSGCAPVWYYCTPVVVSLADGSIGQVLECAPHQGELPTQPEEDNKAVGNWINAYTYEVQGEVILDLATGM